MKTVLITKEKATHCDWYITIHKNGKQVLCKSFDGDEGQAASMALMWAGDERRKYGGARFCQIVAPREVMVLIEKSGYKDGYFEPDILTLSKAKEALQRALDDSFEDDFGFDPMILSNRIKAIIDML